MAAFIFLRSLISRKRSLRSFFDLSHIKACDDASIWIHAVSLGEVNTAKPLIEELKKVYASYPIYVSTITETGLDSARQIHGIHAFYLPLDLGIIQKKLIKRIKPRCLVYIEGDVWPSLSSILSKKHIPQLLLSAKISEKSLSRLKKWPKIGQFVLGNLTGIGAQDEVMKQRFESLNLKNVVVTGNLKLIKTQATMSDDQKRKLEDFLTLDPSKKTVVIASTHQQEELLILEALKERLGFLNIVIAPRHPQRFSSVQYDLQSKGYRLKIFSKPSHEKNAIFFLNATGLLKTVYQQADLVILGGSFIEGVGGHNLLEPIFEGAPVLTGPYIGSQKTLERFMTVNKLGLVVDLEKLDEALEKYLKPGMKAYVQEFACTYQETLKPSFVFFQHLVSL